MMVFAAPLLIAMAAGAAAALATALSRRVRPALLLAAGAAALTPMVRARVLEAREPFRGEDARALVGVYQERPVRGEPVYVGARGLPSWVFYTTNWSRPDRARLDFYARAATEGPSFENAPPRRFPIVQEGDELVYTYRGRRELLGLSTGRHWRWPRYVSPEVDEGWATNEARRIAGAADPCIWLYFTRMSERAYRPVTWHLREHYQGRIEAMTTVPGGVLTRYCFPRTPAQLEALLRWKASLAPPAP